MAKSAERNGGGEYGAGTCCIAELNLPEGAACREQSTTEQKRNPVDTAKQTVLQYYGRAPHTRSFAKLWTGAAYEKLAGPLKQHKRAKAECVKIGTHSHIQAKKSWNPAERAVGAARTAGRTAESNENVSCSNQTNPWCSRVHLRAEKPHSKEKKKTTVEQPD
jgi:hypothetical protein